MDKEEVAFLEEQIKTVLLGAPAREALAALCNASKWVIEAAPTTRAMLEMKHLALDHIAPS